MLPRQPAPPPPIHQNNVLPRVNSQTWSASVPPLQRKETSREARGELSIDAGDKVVSQSSWQGPPDYGQVQQPPVLEQPCASAEPSRGAVKLKLRKSASLVDFMNQKLAEQGCQRNEPSEHASATDTMVWRVDPSCSLLDTPQHPISAMLSSDRSSSPPGTVNGSSASSSQAWGAVQGNSAPAAELPMSQSQLDLESFAASILLDDLQIMGDDSAGKSGNGSSTLQGGDSSSADQVMQPAQLPQEAGSFCEEAAWAGAQGWGPELTALAAGDFSMQSPFTPNDESGLGQQSALDSPDLQLHRAASVPFMQQPQHFSVEVAACASPGRGLARTVSMPGAESSPRRKARSTAGLLKTQGSAGVTKASPRSMVRAASAMDIPLPTLLGEPFIGAIL